MALVLIVLYFCGVIVQNRIWHFAIFAFTIANLLFWLLLEGFYPLSQQASQQQPLFIATIIALGMTVLVTCVNEMLKTEKNLAGEILDKYAELSEARQDLAREEVANAAKTTFLANISHELRTPLNSILGFTDLLKDPDTDEHEKHVFLDAVERNGRQLARLVDDLLDLSKIEAGRLEIEHLEFSLQEVLKEVSEMITPAARKKNLALHFDFTSAMPSHVISDPTRIKQILINIIGNAVKFTEEGEVVVLLSYRQEMVEVNVIDTGRGISDEEKERLFKPFSQADASMTRQYGGTGLGLNLSRKFAELLGGTLELIHSERGLGSVFRFTFAAPLPLCTEFILDIAGGVEDKNAVIDKGAVFKNDLRGVQILVVDDAPDNLNLLEAYLNTTGAEVSTAENGEVALQKARHHAFDAVLMDIQMPVMDGYEATKRLRASGFKGVIIAVTAHAMKSELQKCLEAGCTDYLTKPVQRGQLLEKLEHVKAQAIRRPRDRHP